MHNNSVSCSLKLTRSHITPHPRSRSRGVTRCLPLCTQTRRATESRIELDRIPPLDPESSLRNTRHQLESWLSLRKTQRITPAKLVKTKTPSYFEWNVLCCWIELWHERSELALSLLRFFFGWLADGGVFSTRCRLPFFFFCNFRHKKHFRPRHVPECRCFEMWTQLHHLCGTEVTRRRICSAEQKRLSWSLAGRPSWSQRKHAKHAGDSRINLTRFFVVVFASRVFLGARGRLCVNCTPSSQLVLCLTGVQHWYHPASIHACIKTLIPRYRVHFDFDHWPTHRRMNH